MVLDTMRGLFESEGRSSNFRILVEKRIIRIIDLIDKVNWHRLETASMCGGQRTVVE